MTSTSSHSWQSIQQTIRKRIQDRTWKPGELIPGEAELAEEYGCARATVNRALRELASSGIVDRKRKAGTRVALNRARKVTGAISVIRVEVESLGAAYHFDVIEKKHSRPPADIRKALSINTDVSALYIRSVHYADNHPYIVEERWVNTEAVPDIVNIKFDHISVNEWLVEHIPLTSGNLVISAQVTTPDIADHLKVKRRSAVLRATRSTWLDGVSVTIAHLHYAPGFQIGFDF